VLCGSQPVIAIPIASTAKVFGKFIFPPGLTV
jgi:hypothetical protein